MQFQILVVDMIIISRNIVTRNFALCIWLAYFIIYIPFWSYVKKSLLFD